ncbi:putative holin-like toxin [Vagococcus sp. BWB3-3]|uniref:Holin-like toxin n=1 Tax=Vagococcus allomyrinae TaxID=2794353 RepID=A0A940PC96_9ENTE|nr:putative holin-like toxin [Vagococcus allomyrinae]
MEIRKFGNLSGGGSQSDEGTGLVFKEKPILSVLETINLMLGFGMFTIALVKLVVELLKKTKK